MATYIENELKVYAKIDADIYEFNFRFEDNDKFCLETVFTEKDLDDLGMSKLLGNIQKFGVDCELTECKHDDICDEPHGSTLVSKRYRFETTYHVPRAFIKFASKLFPKLIFELFSIDESGGDTYILYQGGQLLKGFESEKPSWVSIRLGLRERFYHCISRDNRFVETFNEKLFRESMITYANEYSVPTFKE